MKKLIIIGGGLSGLSAGVYARLHGFDTTIIEKNKEVGGLCTTWYKDGITIDGCIHWLTGSSKGNMMPIYKELDLLKGVKILKPDFFYKFYYGDSVIEIKRDLDDFKKELLQYAETDNDKELVKQFIKMVKKLKNMPFHSNKPIDTMKKTEIVGYIKSIAGIALTWNKTMHISLYDFSEYFNSEILKHFFISFMPKFYSLTYFAALVAQFTNDNADTIYSISSDLAMNVKNRFLELGGNIITGEEITKLNICDDKIISIESKNKVYDADYFINASPLPYFYNNLLDKKYHDSYIDYVFKDVYNYPLISTVYVAMKIDKDYPNEVDHFSLIYDNDGIVVGRSHNETIHYRAYPHNKNNDGSTTLIALVDLHVEDYDIFKNAKDKNTYQDLKMSIAKKVLNIYVNKFKDMEGHISIVDVATPLTFEKFTNTYKGAYLSNLATPVNERRTFDIKDKRVNNLYHAGQWVTQIGGIPRALSNGKFAVDELVFQNNNEQRKK
ncbi:MAG: FAD-dependent oxidoreductase [Acholeplasmatales bacterium]|nr:FAD-dependent oxidoreductase [Acholeplasmatales bacterium]